MSLSEFITAVEAENAALENRLTRCDAFLEAVDGMLAVNIKEAELKVLTENGTSEDFTVLKEAAEDESSSKIVKTLAAIVESIRTFFKNIAAKVAAFFDSEKTKITLDAVKKAAGNNPKIANLKIKLKDTRVIDKAFGEEESALNRLIAKARSGNVSESDIAGVRKATDNRKKMVATASTIVVGIGAAIGIAELYRKKIIEHRPPEALSREEWDKLTPEAKEAYREAIKVRAKLEKERGAAWASAIKEAISKACNAIQGKKDIGPSDEAEKAADNVTNESTADVQEESAKEESTFDAESELDALVNSIITEENATEENASDDFDARAAFEELLATVA